MTRNHVSQGFNYKCIMRGTHPIFINVLSNVLIQKKFVLLHPKMRWRCLVWSLHLSGWWWWWWWRIHVAWNCPLDGWDASLHTCWMSSTLPFHIFCSVLFCPSVSFQYKVTRRPEKYGTVSNSESWILSYIFQRIEQNKNCVAGP